MTWFSEKNPPMGGPRGLALIGLLNARDLHDVSILVRETIQNSWDARLSDRESVLVQFSGWTLSASQATDVRRIFKDGLPTTDAVNSVRTSLASKALSILMVRDVNCHGLEGATLPNEMIEGEKNRYVSFMLNFGDSKHSEGDGGSYGFGRSITYRMSRSRFILVYTRTRNLRGELESRFIGSLLTKDFDGHTGRHWWGDTKVETCEPVIGEKADELAGMIGAPIYGAGDSGTTVLILDPVITDLGKLMRFISDSIVWNMWPKMIPRLDGSIPMIFEVLHEQYRVEMKNPMETYPISEFCKAFQLLRRADGQGGRRDKHDQLGQIVHSIDVLRPRQKVGLLALRQFAVAAHTPTWASLSDAGAQFPISAAPFEAHPSHVALLRTPELVVSYLPYSPSPDERIAWCGVFRPFDVNDKYFRSAEPPTHDSWVPHRVTDPDGRTAVRVSLRRIGDFTENLIRSIGPDAPKSDMAVQALARELSNAFDSDPEGEPGRGSGRGRGARSGSVALEIGSKRLSMRSGGIRQLTCRVSIAEKGFADSKLTITLVVGVVEGDESGPVPDTELVHLISVEDHRSVSIWRPSGNRVSNVDLQVNRLSFPLRVVVALDGPYAVAIDARGRKI